MRTKDLFYNNGSGDNNEDKNEVIETPKSQNKMKKWAKVLWIILGLVVLYFGTFFLSYNMMINNSWIIKKDDAAKLKIEQLENENKNLRQEVTDLRNKYESDNTASSNSAQVKDKPENVSVKNNTDENIKPIPKPVVKKEMPKAPETNKPQETKPQITSSASTAAKNEEQPKTIITQAPPHSENESKNPETPPSKQ